jgi:hypothetical protein
MILDDN